MSHPSVPSPGMALAAYPHPIALPPGWGALIVSANRGPYLVPAPSTCKLKIDGREVSGMAEGTFHVAVPAGEHDVRFTDLFGIPMITTRVVVQPNAGHQLSFRFGGWRNRVHDGQGTDVTTFGMWSNYSILLITLGVVGVICCGGLALIPMLTSSGAN
ncbi:hypothetical protein ACN28C_15460 [Plantactinospora sp. WMMC1484]|uniref:hypothetical protein n=1 Tax=Plantactinospora sp. WMMC1484 TaxID=3404122 RepID=UPI003BF5BDBE